MVWLLLLILWPAAEIFVAIQVAGAIGILPMLLLLIVSWPLGTWAVRREGRTVMRRLSAALAGGRTPGSEVLDGALVLAGGALLIVPGFITDFLGIVLLAPPLRAGVRKVIARNVRSRFIVRAASFGAGRMTYDVDSTAVDADPRPADTDPPHLRA
jgi:UPF0716 protein FxsA